MPGVNELIGILIFRSSLEFVRCRFLAQNSDNSCIVRTKANEKGELERWRG